MAKQPPIPTNVHLATAVATPATTMAPPPSPEPVDAEVPATPEPTVPDPIAPLAPAKPPIEVKVFYAQQADGVVVAFALANPTRKQIRAELEKRWFSHMQVVWHQIENSKGAPWLANGPDGDMPIDTKEVPESVRDIARAAAGWQGTHYWVVSDGRGNVKLLPIFADERDGGGAVGYTLNEWLAVGQADLEFDGQDWFFQGVKCGLNLAHGYVVSIGAWEARQAREAAAGAPGEA